MSSSSSSTGPRLDPVEKLLERVTIDRDCLPEGSPVGSFVLHEVLERGDFSVFYRAGSSASASTVLIEEYFPLPLASRNAEGELVVRESGFTPWFAAGLEAFVEETQQLSQPSHPALVTLGPVWRLRNTAYRLRIEHAGALLAQHLDERDRPPEERWLRALAEPLLGALASVHEADRVHGNVRPQNIVLQAEGLLPLLLEFDAARAAVARVAPWLAAPLEPDFSAPELQLYGAVATPAADLYSLAAVLVYCMLGEVPVPARATDKRSGPSRLNAMIEELQRRHPTLHYSEPFVAALERALSFDPENRPQSVEAFLQDLARPPAVRPPPVVAPPVVRAPVVEAPREAAPREAAPRPHARPEPGLFADPVASPRPAVIAADSACEPLWHLPQLADDDRHRNPPTLTQEAWARLSEPMPLSAPMPLLSPGGRIEADPWPPTRGRVAPKPRRWPWLVGGAFVGAGAMVLVGFGIERLSDDERLARLLSAAPAALGTLLPGPADANTPATPSATPTPSASAVTSAVSSGATPAPTESAQKAAPVAAAGVAAGSMSAVAGVTAGAVSRPASAANPPPAPRRPAVAPAARETVALKGSESRVPASRTQPVAVTDPVEACSPRTNFALYLCVKRQCEQTQFYAHPQCVQQRREDQP